MFRLSLITTNGLDQARNELNSVLTASLRCAFEKLASGGATEDDLAEIVQQDGDGSSLPALYILLDALRRRGWLCAQVVDSGGIVIATYIYSHGDALSYRPCPKPDCCVTLSRFAYCKAEEGVLTLGTPFVGGVMRLETRETAELIHAIARPVTVNEAQIALSCLGGSDVATELIALLSHVRAIDCRSHGPAMESEALRQWEFHDLLFHSCTRFGRVGCRSGGTHRFRGELPPTPALKPIPWPKCIDLPKAEATDTPSSSFREVADMRRSLRAHGKKGLCLKALGEFLRRVGEVHGIRPAAPELGRYYDTSWRSYPSGGACYELELYLTVSNVVGLPLGLYYYNPAENCLHLVATEGSLLNKVIDRVSVSGVRPHVLFTITARFQRVAWKYEAIAYSLILKNVGVLYSYMYLIATDLGLAPCALGGGDSTAFLALTGLDRFVEAPVGEFILGRRDE